MLDAWGGVDRPYREIASWLRDEHGVSSWWAQKLGVEYQQARGVRAPGSRPDGTFTVSASRTIRVSRAAVTRAFTDATVRERWLPDAEMRGRDSRQGRPLRFDWREGSTRLRVDLDEKGPSKTLVSVEHERLPDLDRAEAVKAMWKERLAALGALLES